MTNMHAHTHTHTHTVHGNGTTSGTTPCALEKDLVTYFIPSQRCMQRVEEKSKGWKRQHDDFLDGPCACLLHFLFYNGFAIVFPHCGYILYCRIFNEHTSYSEKDGIGHGIGKLN